MLDQSFYQKADEIIAFYGKKPASLIPIMQDIQGVYRYLPEELLTYVAEQIGVTYDSELLRVIIHGVLHLCGIDDKGPGEREVMEAEENKALSIYKNLR